MRARAVLLLLVLAAGVLGVSPRASAHTASSHRWERNPQIQYQVNQGTLDGLETPQQITISRTSGGAGAASDHEILACPWTSVTPASQVVRPTGCTVIVDRPSNTLPFNVNVTPTAAMIANGGFAVVFVSYFAPGVRIVNVSDWVHLTPAIVVSPTALTVTEGTSPTASYTVRLSVQPTGAVDVYVDRGDSGYVLRKAGGTGQNIREVLSFSTSNWNTGQAVTVIALDDETAVGGTSNITHTTPDAQTADEYDPVSKNLPVTLIDDDAAIVLSASALTVTEGTSPAATYTVRLGGRPSGGVRVRVTRGDGSYTVRKAGGTGTSSEDLDFTTANWNTGQTVTVTALDDQNAVGGMSNVTHETVDADTAAEFDPVSKTLPVTVNDDDAVIAVSRGTGALRLTEGVATTYTVALGGSPTGPVVVDVTSADAGAVAAAPGTLTFTATTWDTGRTVTVRAVPDADGNEETVTVTHAVDDAGSAAEFDPAPDVTFPVNVREAVIAVSRGTGALARWKTGT